MGNTCCKNCTERHIGCHSVCTSYNQFVKENEERKRRYRESIYVNETFINYSNQKYYSLCKLFNK